MNKSVNWLLSRAGRKWLYSVSVAAIPLLVIIGKIDSGEASAWLSIIAAILGVAAPTMALAHLTPISADQPDDITIPEGLDHAVALDIHEEA